MALSVRRPEHRSAASNQRNTYTALDSQGVNAMGRGCKGHVVLSALLAMSMVSSCTTPVPPNASISDVTHHEDVPSAPDTTPETTATALSVEITSPLPDTVTNLGAALEAQAMVTGAAPETTFEWRSDRDGLVGGGVVIMGAANASIGLLSPGLHTLTCNAKDSEGTEAAASVSIRVNQPPLGTPEGFF